MKVPIFSLAVEDNGLRLELLDAVDKVLQHGMIMLGPEVGAFEEKIAQFVGTRYAVGVSSGSSALFLALKSIGVGPGDEVITTPLTWIITVHAIAACGATPVFVDVRDDFNINPDLIEPAITKATKAIVPMHYCGSMCEMDRICAIAEKYKIFVVEDAAQAFGAEYQSKKAGSFSKIGAFSMNSMKPLASYGEAGVVVTDDQEIYEKIRILRHAGTKSDPTKRMITNEAHYVSLNHKMDTIQAAMLSVAMKRLPQKRARINAIAGRYTQMLSEHVKCPQTERDDARTYFTYPIQTDRRDELKKHLTEKQIETKIYHIPLACDAPVYSHLKGADAPVARMALEKTLSLPCHEQLSDEQVEYVIHAVLEFFAMKKGAPLGV